MAILSRVFKTSPVSHHNTDNTVHLKSEDATWFAAGHTDNALVQFYLRRIPPDATAGDRIMQDKG